jgi:uncharacterized protein (DUF3084 family)
VCARERREIVRERESGRESERERECERERERERERCERESVCVMTESQRVRAQEREKYERLGHLDLEYSQAEQTYYILGECGSWCPAVR